MTLCEFVNTSDTSHFTHSDLIHWTISWLLDMFKTSWYWTFKRFLSILRVFIMIMIYWHKTNQIFSIWGLVPHNYSKFWPIKVSEYRITNAANILNLSKEWWGSILMKIQVYISANIYTDTEILIRAHWCITQVLSYRFRCGLMSPLLNLQLLGRQRKLEWVSPDWSKSSGRAWCSLSERRVTTVN